MYRRYFITPTRLAKNPFLYRSVGLLATLKPNQEIHLPEETQRWLKTGNPPNWTVISPENVALCLKYADYHISFDWKSNIPVAEKVLDLALPITSKDKKNRILGNEFLREETLTNFLEKDLKDLADKVAVEKTQEYGYSDARSKLSDHVSYIAGNSSLKTYQLEIIWRTIPKQIDAARYVLGRVGWKIVPDYILNEMLDQVQVLEDSYNYGSNLYGLFKEAQRRGMFVRNTLHGVTVPSEPRPAVIAGRPIIVAPVVELVTK